ncbi:MAG: HdeD family acid-resistance protein [Blastococcus sp.]
MTAGVSRSYSGSPPARHSGVGRTAAGVLGVAAVAVGVVLLFNPYAAAHTLALLIGLALVVGGGLEIAVGWESDRRWLAILPGLVLVAGGIIAAFWPKATLWVLALVIGVSLLLHGIARIALAFLARAEIPGWGWLVLAGAFNVLVGILALAWPQATIVVLSLILGAQIIVFGICLVVFAFAGSRSAASV